MGSDGQETTELAFAVARVASQVAEPVAGEVDRQARFPAEALEALRAERTLSALIPLELGGMGASVSQVAEATAVLARH